MKKIYVIAAEVNGIDDGEIQCNLGAWENPLQADLKCLELNAKNIPEDDSPYDNKFYVVELDVNE